MRNDSPKHFDMEKKEDKFKTNPFAKRMKAKNDNRSIERAFESMKKKV